MSGTSTTLTQTDTVYDSCGCSPLGKLKQTSLPHAPGAGAVWTTYTYDGIGRTLSVQLPDGASTTTYSYQGNLVTVTDPAGAWKKYTSDAFGRLTQVEEPNPAGGSYFTAYTYDLLDHLIGVSMPRPTGTQTRTFNYIDPATSKPGTLLRSATNPENGTVTYAYDSSMRLSTVTDAKNQQKVMTYDSLSRVTQVQRYYYSGGSYVEDPNKRTNFYYDSNPFSTSQNTSGRLAAVQYYGGHCDSYALSSVSRNCQLMQEWYGYSQPGARLSKTLKVARGPSATLTASWTYDNEGHMTGVTYPSWQSCSTCSIVSGSHYTFAYDNMERMNTMTDTVNTHTLVSGITYGVANEVQQITSGYTTGVNSETHTFNGMFQLTQLQVGSSALNIQYNYSATQNNGKITSQTDVISGEQIAYAYDALNRLASAQTMQVGGTQWGQSYTYDGFGNLTDQTVIKGSAPDVHVAYNASNNRQTGDTADANGNIGSGYLYDIDNRIVQPVASGSVAYGYDAGNKRVWRGDTNSGLDEIAFWAGQKLATYQVSSGGSGVYFALTSTNVYFGGKLISKGSYSTSWTDKVALAPVVADRQGSIKKFYPYGTERPSATANDTEKFTGYFRDASTGLDYADQRYEQPGNGRFMTPDPYGGSAKASDPGSWNRYAYVGGDPVNNVDPGGLDGDPTFTVTGTGILPPEYDFLLLPEDQGPGYIPLGEWCLMEPDAPACQPIGFYTKFPGCNPNNSVTEDRALQFVMDHYADAKSVADQVDHAFGLGLTTAQVLGWMGKEAGWAETGWGVASGNNNPMNLKTGVNWVGQTTCGPGTDNRFACFSSWQDGALSAFFSPINMLGYQSANGPIDRPSAGFILWDQLSRGSTLAQAFQQVASGGTKGGFIRGSADYGDTIQWIMNDATRREYCLLNNGYMGR